MAKIYVPLGNPEIAIGDPVFAMLHSVAKALPGAIQVRDAVLVETVDDALAEVVTRLVGSAGVKTYQEPIANHPSPEVHAIVTPLSRDFFESLTRSDRIIEAFDLPKTGIFGEADRPAVATDKPADPDLPICPYRNTRTVSSRRSKCCDDPSCRAMRRAEYAQAYYRDHGRSVKRDETTVVDVAIPDVEQLSAALGRAIEVGQQAAAAAAKDIAETIKHTHPRIWTFVGGPLDGNTMSNSALEDMLRDGKIEVGQVLEHPRLGRRQVVVLSEKPYKLSIGIVEPDDEESSDE
jgi:hypothetical protein